MRLSQSALEICSRERRISTARVDIPRVRLTADRIVWNDPAGRRRHKDLRPRLADERRHVRGDLASAGKGRQRADQRSDELRAIASEAEMREQLAEQASVCASAGRAGAALD